MKYRIEQEEINLDDEELKVESIVTIGRYMFLVNKILQALINIKLFKEISRSIIQKIF